MQQAGICCCTPTFWRTIIIITLVLWRVDPALRL
uniref:Uncharacterized protein n=1 Tax=Physcomitrium patens TaxID=3218 RepID=A0A2K1IKB8_PHYPA|nr:hypothetical protein PHYPA_028419 [Physcomitrium patens]